MRQKIKDHEKKQKTITPTKDKRPCSKDRAEFHTSRLKKQAAGSSNDPQEAQFTCVFTQA
jgi:hypothetical protein